MLLPETRADVPFAAVPAYDQTVPMFPTGCTGSVQPQWLEKGVRPVNVRFFRLCAGLGLAVFGLSSMSAWAASYELQDNALVVPSPVVFETGGDGIRPESEAALQHVANYLKDKTYISLLRIESHTDNQGDPAKNQALTEKRSMSVGRWLIAHGIDCQRLLAVGFGSTKPVADNRSPEGRSQNRRVRFVNAALRGRAIGGMPVDGGGHVAGDLCK